MRNLGLIGSIFPTASTYETHYCLINLDFSMKEILKTDFSFEGIETNAFLGNIDGNLLLIFALYGLIIFMKKLCVSQK